MAREMLVLRNVCMNFPVIIKPGTGPDGEGKEKYSMTVMVPKSDTETIARIEAAVDKAIEENIGTFGGKKSGIRRPLRDGDEKKEDYPEFDGYMFFSCSTIHRPKVFDMEKQEIIDLEEVIYSGQVINVSVLTFPYNVSGSKGIGMGLQNIQVVGGGERWFDNAGAEF